MHTLLILSNNNKKEKTIKYFSIFDYKNSGIGTHIYLLFFSYFTTRDFYYATSLSRLYLAKKL